MRNMLKRIAAKADLEKRVYPHGLRHTHAAQFHEGALLGLLMTIAFDMLEAAASLAWTAPVRLPAPGTDDRETAARRYDDLRADDARAQPQVEDLEAELLPVHR